MFEYIKLIDKEIVNDYICISGYVYRKVEFPGNTDSVL
jgi:hypothetical protein